MAITVQNVTMNGVQLNAGGTGSSFTVTKRLVSDTAIDLKVAADVATLKTAAFGDPLDPLIVTPTNASDVGQMRLRTTSIVPVPGSANKVFDVVGKYDQLYTWMDISAGGGTAALALPVEVEFDATPRSVILYRSPYSTLPSANLNTTTDIGGTKVDYASKPVPGLVPQMRARISLIVDASVTGQTLNSVYDRISSAVGRWNSTDFLHWGAQGVYCETANIAAIRDEYYRVTYNFVWDLWYACEQIPKTDVNGRAAVDSNGSAITVTWKSQNRGTYDHNNIFNEQPNPTLAKQIAREGCFLTYP